jgi:predicted nucleic acid-binding protein
VIQAVHTRYVVDASVAAKWFTRHGEADREKALALREFHRARRCRLVFPEFGLLEVLNAIRFSPRAEEADTAAALAVLSDLQLQIEPMDWDLLRKATAIAWAYGVALSDAAYVALAERLGFPFLTADEALLKRMNGHSIVLRLRDLRVERSG